MSLTPPKPPSAAAPAQQTEANTAANAQANSSASPVVNDPNEVLGEFDGGNFMLILARALTSLGLSVIEHDRKGKINIELSFTKIKNTQQLAIGHSLKFSRPTMDGEAAEKVSRETVMHVGKYGKLTVMLESQLELIPRHPPAGA